MNGSKVVLGTIPDPDPPCLAPKSPKVRLSVDRPIPTYRSSLTSFFHFLTGSRTLLQNLTQWHTLDSHHGCVNTLAWNAGGNYLLSGSDDHRLIITDPFSRRVRSDVLTAHRANIFSAQFLPHTSDVRLVSAAGDGILAYTHIERAAETRQCLFNCHHGTAYEILTWPGDPHTFLSCGEDGTVRWFDLRIKDRCDRASCQEDVLISGPDPVTAMAIDPVVPYRLAVGTSDSAVRLFDRRVLGTKSTGQTQSRCLAALLTRFVVPELRGKHRRITAVNFRPDGREILASYSSDYVYVFDPQVSLFINAMKRDSLYFAEFGMHRQSKRSIELQGVLTICIVGR